MIILGDEVEDTITGFRGIAVVRCSYLTSPDNISIQPVVNRYGELPEAQVFTESLLRVIKARKKKVAIVKNIKKGDD